MYVVQFLFPMCFLFVLFFFPCTNSHDPDTTKCSIVSYQQYHSTILYRFTSVKGKKEENVCSSSTTSRKRRQSEPVRLTQDQVSFINLHYVRWRSGPVVRDSPVGTRKRKKVVLEPSVHDLHSTFSGIETQWLIFDVIFWDSHFDYMYDFNDRWEDGYGTGEILGERWKRRWYTHTNSSITQIIYFLSIFSWSFYNWDILFYSFPECFISMNVFIYLFIFEIQDVKVHLS